ncbi:EGF-like repeat and discoidin I-like domain-containing protein 3 [Acanthaster planci]|uniref:EGF-like repeat and discoidin I-like domain-containing protein 3 n=1 Tax=Acanthaster planci TaxID=133434 RepID=A0A8B7ZZ93_ACAPL|nr:EGF-like repeat and discoidin I-like domain-containing protein 3 [Acanthaster planci]
MPCLMEQEPDPASQNRYRWLLPVEEPCQCSEVKIGPLNTRVPYRPFTVTYYDALLISSNPVEIQSWLNCTGVFTCSVEKPLGMEDGRIPDNHLTASSVLGNKRNCHGPQRARLLLEEGCLCGERLGMEDGSIPDSSITASSVFKERPAAPDNCEPHNGRLNYPGVGSIVGGWCPARNDKESPWFEVDLAKQLQVEGVIIQGSVDPLGSWRERVTAYQVQYSNDRSTWVYVTNGGPEAGPQTFDGNVDQTTPVNSSFNKPIQARYIRIRPTSYNSWPSMRVELLGCKESVGFLCWCAAKNDTNPWMQVNFNNTVLITGLITQGCGDDDCQQWVTAYTVHYSNSGQTSWTTVKDHEGKPVEFLGNSDNHTLVPARFAEVVRTRYLRFLPTEWNGLCCMRFEVMGCTVAN